jgi:hypothetical protein
MEVIKEEGFIELAGEKDEYEAWVARTTTDNASRAAKRGGGAVVEPADQLQPVLSSKRGCVLEGAPLKPYQCSWKAVKQFK